MVDNMGHWTPEVDYSMYPKEKWCDMDWVAAWIQQQGYTPRTSLENLTVMCILHFEGEVEDENSPYCPDYFDDGINIDGLIRFVEAFGGLREFDYVC